MSLELGRFQVTEGLFHPEAWGLDNPGVQKMIHKAIQVSGSRSIAEQLYNQHHFFDIVRFFDIVSQDCSMDIRKEMVSSIFLSGGITLLPNFPERLQAEVDRLTPPHLVPKVTWNLFIFHLLNFISIPIWK